MLGTLWCAYDSAVSAPLDACPPATDGWAATAAAGCRVPVKVYRLPSVQPASFRDADERAAAEEWNAHVADLERCTKHVQRRPGQWRGKLLWGSQAWETGCILKQRLETDPRYAWAEGDAQSPALFYVPMPLPMFKDRDKPKRKRMFTRMLAAMLDNPDWRRYNGTDHFAFVRFTKNVEGFFDGGAAQVAGDWRRMLMLTECATGTLHGARYLAQIFPAPLRHDSSPPFGRGNEPTKVLVAMVAGSRVVSNRRFARVREVVKSQCVVHGDDCHLVELRSPEHTEHGDACKHGVFGGKCKGASIASRQRELAWPDYNDTKVAVAEAYSSATFCIQVGGDLPSRKGVFDSLAYGCIPVVFDRRSIGVFVEHVVDPDAISVYIPKEFVMDGSLDVIRHLKAIPAVRTEQLLANVRAAQHRLQYSFEPRALPQGAAKADYERAMDAADVTIDFLMRGANVVLPWHRQQWFDNFTQYRLVIDENDFRWASGRC